MSDLSGTIGALGLGARAPLADAGEVSAVIATPDRIDAWVAVARPGDRFAYATRQYLPTGSPGPKRLRALEEAGLVHLFQRRSELRPGWFTYFAERTSQRAPVPKPSAARQRLSLRPPMIPDDTADLDVMEQVLAVLERSARFGRPCPTDHQLAERVEAGVEQVRGALVALQADHAIVVHAAPAPTLRRVTILSAGWTTGYAV